MKEEGMKKTGISLLAFLLALLLLCLSGCRTEKTFKNQDDEIIIGFISESMTVERWQRDRDIFVAKAEELGAQVIVKNAYEDSARQIELGKEMIDQGVDVLAIVAYDKDSLKELVDYAHNNNVKVIAYDRLINNADVDLYISFDNYMVGKLMGEAAVATVPEGNYLILNGTKQDSNSFKLNDGYMGVIQPYIDNGRIDVVGEIWVDAWRDELAYNYVSGIINGGVHIDAIIAGDDRLAEGAVNALSENRLAGKVFVSGQDAELGACQRIVQGTQSMTVYKSISILAEGAAEIAVKMAKGEDIGDCGTISDGTYDIDYIVYEPIMVTKDNIYKTIIEGNFYTKEQVYANVPESQWP
jgi:D-xylose transport system substrate-binding protein